MAVSTGAQAVRRALSVLAVFTSARPRWRLAEVARELGLTQSTTSRLLTNLEGFGLLERDPRTGLYSLGLEIVALSCVALNSRDLFRHALAPMARVAEELKHVVNLGVLSGDRVLNLANVDHPANLVPRALTGSWDSIHGSALGAVLVAALPKAEQAALAMGLDYEPYTPHTVHSAEQFLAKVEAAARAGFAIDREEQGLGRGCVAAPIRDETGSVVAACSVSGRISVLDLDRRLAELSLHMIELGDAISRSLGYSPHR